MHPIEKRSELSVCAAGSPDESSIVALIKGALAGTFLLVVLSWWPSGAGAQVGGDSLDEEARALFHAGEVAFGGGRFEEALGHFQRAYELSHRPALLYNIGQAADRARHDETALRAFREYLASDPAALNRTEIEGRIRVLEAATARGAVAPDPTPMPDPEPEPTPVVVDPVEAEPVVEAAPPAAPLPPVSSGPDPAGIGLAVTGGVLAVAGAILLAVGVPDTSATTMPRFGESFDQARARQDQGVGLAVSGGVALGVGVIVGVVGVVLLAVSGGSDGAVRATADGFALSF